jgi:hypothetical protein
MASVLLCRPLTPQKKVEGTGGAALREKGGGREHKSRERMMHKGK